MPVVAMQDIRRNMLLFDGAQDRMLEEGEAFAVVRIAIISFAFEITRVFNQIEIGRASCRERV